MILLLAYVFPRRKFHLPTNLLNKVKKVYLKKESFVLSVTKNKYSLLPYILYPYPYPYYLHVCYRFALCLLKFCYNFAYHYLHVCYRFALCLLSFYIHH